MRDKEVKDKKKRTGVSRRDFLKIGGIAAAVPLVVGPTMVRAGGADVEVHGPGKVPIVLHINGLQKPLQVEPRTTLLDALRDQLDMTGAKRVCDRGACGACTVLMAGKAVYACSILAIDAQGKEITTIESLSAPGQLNPLQKAFVEHDGQQCGFCTPGFIMASTALLKRHPKPTMEQIKHDLTGNICRCGTYAGIREALAAVAAMPAPASKKGGPRG